ncbi:hypothetical protein CLF_107669 [Clonorchis sinensis]|uniref:Uncharacterized protein n=1 Tax=Clonorchis sinensis TaxID=79923 RepID=G7YQX4_CLOSI|nr:hypothetical protein CLF_107669 [Clonorchis sinensis]
MLRFMGSPVTVVKGAAIGEVVRGSVAAGSGLGSEPPSMGDTPVPLDGWRVYERTMVQRNRATLPAGRIRPPHEFFIPRACYQICRVTSHQAVVITEMGYGDVQSLCTMAKRRRNTGVNRFAKGCRTVQNSEELRLRSGLGRGLSTKRKLFIFGLILGTSLKSSTAERLRFTITTVDVTRCAIRCVSAVTGSSRPVTKRTKAQVCVPGPPAGLGMLHPVFKATTSILPMGVVRNTKVNRSGLCVYSPFLEDIQPVGHKSKSLRVATNYSLFTNAYITGCPVLMPSVVKFCQDRRHIICISKTQLCGTYSTEPVDNFGGSCIYPEWHGSCQIQRSQAAALHTTAFHASTGPAVCTLNQQLRHEVQCSNIIRSCNPYNAAKGLMGLKCSIKGQLKVPSCTSEPMRRGELCRLLDLASNTTFRGHKLNNFFWHGLYIGVTTFLCSFAFFARFVSETFYSKINPNGDNGYRTRPTINCHILHGAKSLSCYQGQSYISYGCCDAFGGKAGTFVIRNGVHELRYPSSLVQMVNCAAGPKAGACYKQHSNAIIKLGFVRIVQQGCLFVRTAHPIQWFLERANII